MAKQSSLIEMHRSNGATFIEQNGWNLPAHFGDVAGEYRAVRSAAGLIDFAHRGLLQFTGPDRLSFLQGMLSNDMGVLKPFDGAYATILTQQGKVIADVRVLCAMNSFYLDFWENLKDKILAHLNRYLIADEVEIADRSQEYTIISIQGPQSEALLRRIIRPDVEFPVRAKQHAMLDIDGAAVCVVQDTYTGEAGYDLIVPLSAVANIAQKVTDAGTQYDARWVGEEAQNILRIEAGIPRYGVDFSEDNLLLEVGIDHAVSFTKGCYLGQEVVERIRSRGHVNKKLSGLLLDGEPPSPAGAVIETMGRQVGMVTSSVFSPALKRAIALGYLNKDLWSPGQEVSIKTGQSECRATVTELPFVRSP
jgi:glycine cleavage system T protein